MLLNFNLHMLNDINVKNSWGSARCKYQLKQITKTREKKCCNQWKLNSEKKDLQFQNPNLNILRKIAFRNKQIDWIRSYYMERTA